MNPGDEEQVSPLSIQNEGILQAIRKAFPDLLFILDEEGKYLDIVATQEDLMFEPKQVLLGNRIPEVLPEETAKRFMRFIQEILSHDDVSTIKYQINSNRGHRWFEGRGIPLPDKVDGKRTVVWIARDITERVQFEQELETSRNEAEELNLQLEEAVYSAEIAAREASRANRAKSAFLATMSHEIRTPLNALIGMTDLLEISNHEPEQKRYIEVIRSSGNILLSVLNEVLDFSKIESGKLEVEMNAFDPMETLQEVVALFQEKARQRGIDLSYTLKTEFTERIWSDKIRLRHILVNLVDNAVKFTESGKVTIHVFYENSRGSDGKLIVEVMDTGIGINPLFLEEIFHPFNQGESSISRRFGGSGLGLALVKRLTEILGGGVTVSSNPGEGSTFRFWIQAPAFNKENDNDDKASDIETPYEEWANCFPMKILVVEDDALNQKVLIALLQNAGYSPDIVFDGEEAIKAYAKKSYDMIIMDCHLPGINGIEAGRQIRMLSGSVEKPYILALSGHPYDAVRAEGAPEVVSQFLKKPIDRNTLYQQIKLAWKG